MFVLTMEGSTNQDKRMGSAHQVVGVFESREEALAFLESAEGSPPKTFRGETRPLGRVTYDHREDVAVLTDTGSGAREKVTPADGPAWDVPPSHPRMTRVFPEGD